ncbi:hypothetical protein [Herbiconiux sp. VKM Ac-2851]|uniref:TRADD-N-associated membrane domain-containing protein n=1 Tax=Herbiconiux sp. VKM Ac-2851 TaxID=2739025 RepID=UPI001564380C|nr:hypothetical protein [Herbiconiux sp. VKM Ac-2851]NQX33273.1 hypothetical protein [Herbiconiux sp. VKM Ac-2851]
MAVSTGEDAVRIGRSPARASWKLILVVTGVGSAVLASFPAAAYVALGVGEWSWLLGLLTAWALLGGGLLIGLHVAYGGIVWYPGERAAELRGRRVPIDTITEAWRSLSSSGTAAYVVYRFVSTEGPSVRLLVAGRPMKGLDAAGVKDLARFVRELPLVVPDAQTSPLGDEGGPRLSDRQRAAAVSLTSGGGKSRVGRETLLAELGADADTDANAAADADADLDEARTDDRVGNPDPATPEREPATYLPPASDRRRPNRTGDHAVISQREADRLVSEWAADDQHAERMLAAEPGRARPVRRLFFWLMILALGVAALTLVFAVVREESGGGPLGSMDDDLMAALIVGPGVLGLLFYIGWCAASDAQQRHLRRLGARWLEERAREDPEVRRRGLAAEMLAAWVVSVQRLRTVLAFLLSLLGFFVILGGIFFFSEDSVSGGVISLAVGIVMVVISVLLFLRVQRRKKADAEQLVHLGGWRLLPPEIER